MSTEFKGATVLIGRPLGMGKRWREAFEGLGANVVQQPALSIQGIRPDPETMAELASFKAGDCAVFSSRPGVEHGLALPGLKDRLSKAVCWAVGQQTALALMKKGLPRVKSPSDGYGADALLADARFPSSDRVWLFGAQGGRQVMHRTLLDRGIVATPVWVYQRRPAARDVRATALLNTASADGKILVIASSVAVLQRLLELHPQALANQRLISLGDRITQVAQQHSFSTIVTAASPDLPSIIEAARLALA